MRGEGGRLVNAAGERFMDRLDPAGDLAPRDIVARGIVAEMRATGQPCVFLDLSAIESDEARRRFPAIASTCARYGLDIGRDRIPVAPSAHYMMGGVKTDLWGRTSMPGLYAAGEVACTGVHGANRLASNSLLEGLVFGARAGQAVLADLKSVSRAARPAVEPAGILAIDPAAAPPAVEALRQVMWEKVGIIRDGTGLDEAVRSILDLERGLRPGLLSRPGLEARNLLFVGRLIAESALRRTESRGAHFRRDHPEREPGRGRHSVIAPGAPAPDLPRLPDPS
jgi:L-aspartate oxidase